MKRKFSNSGGGNIGFRGGKRYPKPLAKIVGRCLECLGRVDYYNNGLACQANKNHKGIIHRKEAEILAVERKSQLSQVKTNYTIQDGKVIPIKELQNAD